MPTSQVPSAAAVRPAGIAAPLDGSGLPAIRTWAWRPVLVAFAAAMAALALWVTARASFLAHPAWLAAQKADFILGPVLVGLYWLRVRPANRFGWLLIVLGLLGVPYILESSGIPTLFAIGVVAEDPIYVMTVIVILAFPTGRLEGVPERVIVGLLVLCALVILAVNLHARHLAPGLSISECRDACPKTRLGLASPRSYISVDRALAVLPVALDLACVGVIAWRFAAGTPPRRRALAIGAPIGVLFLLTDAAYLGLFIFARHGLGPGGRELQDALQWALAGTRALLWYGFLFALIAAQLQAGRMLRRFVGGSRGHPTLRELEGRLREPLGDPGLRLGAWRPGTREWVSVDGTPLEPPAAGQALTDVDRQGTRLAIVHDDQLAADPELLQAAGAVALLSLQNTELEAAWKDSLRKLSESRARLVQAADTERRKLERDLHDGAQQRLMAIQIKLRLLRDTTDDERLSAGLDAIGSDAEAAVEELRDLAHGIYPPVLRSFGIADALRAFALRAPIPVTVDDTGIGRCPRPVEAAIYFCAMEAVQNAIKHAGEGARVQITLGRDQQCVRFAIADDGAGISGPAPAGGEGLLGMHDRIGAVGGELAIVSSPGNGTMVRGTVPIDPQEPTA